MCGKKIFESGVFGSYVKSLDATKEICWDFWILHFFMSNFETPLCKGAKKKKKVKLLFFEAASAMVWISARCSSTIVFSSLVKLFPCAHPFCALAMIFGFSLACIKVISAPFSPWLFFFHRRFLISYFPHHQASHPLPLIKFYIHTFPLPPPFQPIYKYQTMNPPLDRFMQLGSQKERISFPTTAHIDFSSHIPIFCVLGYR